jgi:hypothetical protein
MRRIPAAWRQASGVAAGVVAELALALGFCALGLLICAAIGILV